MATLSPERGYFGERRGKVMPPAEWVSRLQPLQAVEDPNVSGGRLFVHYYEQTRSPFVARIIVTRKDVKLPHDIRGNGLYHTRQTRFYHRMIDRPERLEELEGMQRNGKVRITGFYSIPKTKHK
jgi:hypothetical protein